jgi:glycosyltransferase EpsE
MENKVAVLMAVRNCESTLRKSIDSILSQADVNVSLYVCDDCSDDSTFVVAHEYDAPNVHLYRNTSNIGQAATLNKLIDISTEDFIAIADGDDSFLPGKLAAQLIAFEDPSVFVVGTGARVWCDNNHQDVFMPPMGEGAMFRSCFFHSSVVIRREFFNVVGYYDERLLRSQDRDLWIRGSKRGLGYRNLDAIFLNYNSNCYVRSWATIFKLFCSLLLINHKHSLGLKGLVLSSRTVGGLCWKKLIRNL